MLRPVSALRRCEVELAISVRKTRSGALLDIGSKVRDAKARRAPVALFLPVDLDKGEVRSSADEVIHTVVALVQNWAEIRCVHQIL